MSRSTRTRHVEVVLQKRNSSTGPASLPSAGLSSAAARAAATSRSWVSRSRISMAIGEQ